MPSVPKRTRTNATAATRLRPGAPRYQVVADALIADIERGVYAVGDLLPGELEIAQRYGLSRHTTREALRCLEELGLISRRPGIGTLVKARSTQSHYTAGIEDLAELSQHTRQTHLKELAEEWVTIEGELSHYLPGAQGQRWLRFRTLRYPAKGAEPISYTEIYVHPVFERIRERINEPDMRVYRLIEEQHGERVHELRQEISAIGIPADVAPFLKAEPGAPALHVVRVYLGKKDSLLSMSVNIYPQHRFKVTTRWQMSKGRG